MASWETIMQSLDETELYLNLVAFPDNETDRTIFGHPPAVSTRPGEDDEGNSAMPADSKEFSMNSQLDEHVQGNQSPLSAGSSEDLYTNLEQSPISTGSSEDLYASAEELGDACLSSDDLKAQKEELPETAISLRGYQTEVAQHALKGRNIIVCLPTGTGKTRVAIFIAAEHLQNHPQNGKVIFIVNRVALVEQHLKEFRKYLKRRHQIRSLVGVGRDASQLNCLAAVLKDTDIIICTAQILHNAFEVPTTDEDEQVLITDFSLIIFDECHHTDKEAVYNKIMMRYLLVKEEGTHPLPQIVGLTASPGTGRAKNIETAREHVMQICANLDAWELVVVEQHTKELMTYTNDPVKRYEIADKREQDPFADRVKNIMRMIHDHCGVMPSENFGSQSYEQQIVGLEKEGVEKANRHVQMCARHLRKYNDVLLINDTVRQVDAYKYLESFYEDESTKEMLDDTDNFLAKVFAEHKEGLGAISPEDKCENPKLNRLQSTILSAFLNNQQSRGIVFTRTRQSAMALHEWVTYNELLKDVGVRSHHLTGAGNQVGHMTAPEQSQVLLDFREGKINLLISTTVGEEGLDIKECNFVVRYQHATNETAMVQIRKIQEDSIVEWKLKIANEYERKNKCPATQVKILCRNCHIVMCKGNDLRLVDGMHRVCVRKNFSDIYIANDTPDEPMKFAKWELGSGIFCKKCKQSWGMQMIFKGTVLPCISIKSVILQMNDSCESRRSLKNWSKVPFAVEPFDYVQFCKEMGDFT
uniref:ATP-dependent RNA helicase DHX58-like isoform X2 n=1 Tax=Myxine glutinosa TaxID=7769 RepID=UPI00358DF329